MKKILVLVCFIATISPLLAQHTFTSREAKVSFFSEAPLENIEAHNTSVRAIINTSTREVGFIVPVRQFKFRKALMEEHFNEKYLESDKFPMATFEGKISEEVNFSKDGTYKVTAGGKLKIHGVEHTVTCPGEIVIKNGQINLESEFNVLVKDYNITIPKLVFQNIAESIRVNLSVKFIPYKK